MNAFIEISNRLSENFLNFAWPMFWQSSLLILILFAFDFLLRRKLRASIRYALWLIVLIKLILPPTLALPTNPIWWLNQTPSVVAKIPKPNYTVTYDQNFPPEVSEQTLPAFVPPKPELTIASWLLAISICVSLALLFWMLARWRQVTKQVRRAQFSGRITMLAAEAQKFGNFKFNFQPQVKLTANSMSPAVCGLFRPAILIPQSLAENFSDEQLRAVLLHELIHLRRGDVWLNFAQTLLQIFYWWHPLLWLANARIRRVREEAVDDAVMLTLRDDAETYAPTLLEVAKLALNRPLATLGLVGILESRHALRQRIERLLNFRAPKKVGLTFLSFCGIFIFSAVALPMGNAPTSPNENQIVSAPSEKNVSATKTPEKNISAPKTNVPEILITTHLYHINQNDFEKISALLEKIPSAETENANWLVSEKEFDSTRKKLISVTDTEIFAPRVVTLNSEGATMSVRGTNGGIKFSCVPSISSNKINLAINGQTIVKKNNLILTNFFDARGLAENGGGFLIYAKNPNNSVESNLVILINAKIITDSAQIQEQLKQNVKSVSGQDFNQTEILLRDAKLFYEMGKFDEAETNLNQILALDFDNAKARYYLNLIQETKLKRQGTNAELPAKAKFVRKLYSTYVDNFGPFQNADWKQVIHQLNEKAVAADPQKIGVNVFFEFPSNTNSVFINMPAMRKHITFGAALSAVVAGANKPIVYVIRDNSVEFSIRSKNFGKEYFLPKKFILADLQNQSTVKTDDISVLFKNVCANLGVNWNSPSGKNAFYNYQRNELWVMATDSDFEKIDRVVALLKRDEPQVHIKARFLEVKNPGDLDWYLRQFSVSGTNELTGILTSENFKTILQNLEARTNVETLAEPEVVTTSGRQTQMRATKSINVIGSVAFEKNIYIPGTTNADANSTVFKEANLETGPSIDTIATVLSDNETIDLKATASLTEFFGYAPTTNSPSIHFADDTNSVPLAGVQPSVRFQKAGAHVDLYDNQTLMLGKFKTESVGTENFPKNKNKELLVFVTVTLVDAAGNRIHSDDEMPFATNGIPPQPQ